jgi:hypothetical protein
VIRIAKRALILLTIALAGCVVIDGRSWRESTSKEGPAGLSGRFTTKAAYVSKKGNLTLENNLAALMRVRDAQAADTVTMSFSESQGLTVRFEKNSTEILSKVYRPEDGLRVTEEGRIELLNIDGCDAALVQGIPSAGCLWTTITLFSNQSGDLIAVESNSSAMVFAILPVGVYIKRMAVFPRVGKDACDFMRPIYSC